MMITPMLSRIRHNFTINLLKNHHFFRPFCSHPLATHPHHLNPSPPPSPDLINELSRILSDYRNPHHDIESALHPFAPQVSINVVEQVLKRCKNLGFSAHRFFIWAQKLPSFEPSKESYHIVVNILGSSKNFPLMWDFLVELKRVKPNEITSETFWLVFRAYCRADLPDDAIRAFNKMVDFGINPSLIDVEQLLFVLCKRKHVKHAQQVFDKVKDDYAPSVKSYSILIRGWGEIGEVHNAKRLFEEMIEKGCSVDLLAYNSILECLCKGGNIEEAHSLFSKMSSKGLEADAYTYSIFIRAACTANDTHLAFRILDRMKRYSLVPNVFTYNCLLKNLCKNNKVDDAYKLLDEMFDKGVKPDVWSYNVILSFHCDHSKVNGAFKIISRMDEDLCQPDRHTYNMVLKMLIKVGRFDRVENLWESMEKRGFYPSVSTYAVMVHGFAHKKGKVEEACRYFEMMIDEGIPPYNATCELLRNKLIGLGFADQKDILADKMERSTSCSIRELASVMRGDRTRVKSSRRGEYSDESDTECIIPYDY